MKILVISMAGIGDTLFATPLIHELRANFPHARIDALVRWAGARDVLENNPHLNTVFQQDRLAGPKLQSLRLLWRLRREHYDFSLNTHPQSRVHYRAVARLIGAGVRISHRYDHHSLLDHWLVNRSLPQDYARHSAENNLEFLQFLEVRPVLPEHHYEIYLSPAELAWADEYVSANQLASRRLLGLHIGSGGTKNLALRRWPIESYRSLIQRILQAHPEWTVVLLGGPGEREEIAGLLAQSDPLRVLHPPTRNLRQAAAMLRKCAAFLSVDTSLMHVAAAMRVPRQFAIETPTWNPPIEPYHQPFVLIRNPVVAGRNLRYYRYDGRGIQGTREELRRCMASVTVEAVYDALRPTLESR